MLFISTRHSQFCETSVKITEWVSDPLRVSVTFVKGLLLEGGNFDISPNRSIHLMPYTEDAGLPYFDRAAVKANGT